VYVEDFTVLCVWIGTKYGREYVERLGRAVTRDLAPWNRPKLKCITDQKMEGERVGPWTCTTAVPFRHPEEGCWTKLQCFQPGVAVGPTLYLDLDVVVTGELDGYIPKPEQRTLSAMKDAVRKGHFNSSVMAWNAPDMHYMWAKREEYRRGGKMFGKPSGPWRGDQDFIRENLQGEWQELPGALSYKVALHGNKNPPPSCRVAVFHGKPKMADLPPDNTYRRLWEQ
jgi:hypothetical protein